MDQVWNAAFVKTKLPFSSINRGFVLAAAAQLVPFAACHPPLSCPVFCHLFSTYNNIKKNTINIMQVSPVKFKVKHNPPVFAVKK